MFTELYNYGVKNGLSESWTRKKAPHYLVNITKDGEFVDIIENEKGNEMIIPFQTSSSPRNYTANLIFETLVRIFPEISKDKAKRAINHEHYLNLLKEFNQKSILKFLTNENEVKRAQEAICGPEGIVPKGKVDMVNMTFLIDGENPLGNQDLLDKWKQKKEKEFSEADKDLEEGTCSITGQKSLILKRLPATISLGKGGIPLCSYDKEAYEHYGLKNGMNCSISRNAAEMISNSLNQRIDFSESNNAKFRDDLFIFWSNEEETNDPIASLFSIKDEDIAKKIRPIFKKDAIKNFKNDMDTNLFSGAIISNNEKRFIVKMYFQNGLDEIMSNIKEWYNFQDEDWDKNNGKNLYSIPQMLFAIAPIVGGKPETKKIPSRFFQGLVKAAVKGNKIENGITEMILNRCKSDALGNKSISKACLTLINVVLKRRNHIMNSAYHLGKLAAIVEQAQIKAIWNNNNNRGVTIYKKSINQVSNYPQKTFLNFVKSFDDKYYAKLLRDNPGLAIWFKKNIDNLVSEIKVEELRKKMTPEEECSFFKGYHEAQKGESSKEVK